MLTKQHIGMYIVTCVPFIEIRRARNKSEYALVEETKVSFVIRRPALKSTNWYTVDINNVKFFNINKIYIYLTEH